MFIGFGNGMQANADENWKDANEALDQMY